MKKFISNIICGAAVATIAGLWSCTNENPFDSDGQGTVQLHTVVNSIVTRADENPNQALEDSCVVYISNSEKLVKKWKGLQNVDEQITLKAGSYVAEAWTGDSVTASWDKKFYRGYQPFEVTKGSTRNVVVNCRIANVVASINASTINPTLMKDDYTITIKNTRGERVFTKDSLDQKAYFMMPNGDDKLEYEIKGTRTDGKDFEQRGVIEHVERAHHYILNFEYNPTASDSPTGYVFIKINIKDEVIKNDNVTVFTRPTITGVDFDIEQQLRFINDEEIPEVVSVQICGDGIDDIILTPKDGCTWKEILGLDTSNDNYIKEQRPINFPKLSKDDPILKLCEEKGLKYDTITYNEETKIETAHLSFSKELFMRLTDSESEHKLGILVTDIHNQESTALLRTARSEDAIEVPDPIEVYPVPSDDYLSIKANSAYLPFKLAKSYEGTPGVEYSKADEDNWTFVAAPIPAGKPATRADNDYIIKVTGLDEGTSYKYRACCGDFHSEDVFTFTTESKFFIPNYSLEEWSDLSSNPKVRVPSADGNVSFWDSGNHGSATMSKTLTQGSDKMVHSGSYSAELKSQFVGVGSIGKFAAGNLFAGTYKETKGTNGVIEFGRSYNGSHPTGLSFWANYRPGKADSKGKNDTYIKQGETDQAQIYVAISTKPVVVDTSDTKTLFNPNASEILAYGQITWKEDFGPDGQLQQVTIPLEYYDRANTTEAKYLIIVCSASKFGDYFCGGEGSTMYLDDFELIYE